MVAPLKRSPIAELEAECQRLRQALVERDAKCERLERDEALYRAACTHAPDFMAIIDRERRFLWANYPHPSLTMEQVLSSRIDDFADAASLAHSREAIARCFRTHEPLHYSSRPMVAGHELRFDVRGVYLPDRDAVLLVTRDVTDEVRAKADLEHSMVQLSLAQERLETAQRIAGLGYWDWHIQTGEVFWTPGLYAMCGVSPDDFRPTYESYLACVHPEDRERAAATLQRALTQGAAYELEHRVVRPDGSVRWLQGHGEVSRDDDGQVRRVRGTALDVTPLRQVENELRAALAEQTLLLKEVHHRVKNNLQIVASLLSLQADRVAHAGARESLSSCRNRVRTIALIHDELYQNERFASVPFRRLLARLTTQLISGLGQPELHQVALEEVSDVVLPLDMGIPCGLIVNELVTNALKHAFPDGRPGTLYIGLERSGPDMVLVVRDDGVGFDPQGHDGTLGLRIVRTLVEQLDGSLEIDGCDGTAVRMTFPAPAGESEGGVR